MPLVSAEAVIVGYLQAAFPAARVVTETPAGMTGDPAVIQVTRFGGADAIYTLDVCNVDVDVFAAPDRETARDLAEQVRTSLRLHAEGQTVAGGFIAAVSTISAPNWVPYDNTSLRRFTSSYRIAIRSIP